MKKLKMLIQNDLIFPFILSFVLSCTLLSAYNISFFSVWTLLSAVICASTIECCVFIKKIFDKGGWYRFAVRPFVFILCIAIISLSSIISIGNDYGSGFYLWFTEGTKAISTQPNFVIALLMTLPVFFSFVVYYFTRIFYRISFITLVSFIPCMLCIKVADDINIINIAIISILDVILFMIHRYERLTAETKITDERGALISASVFAALLLAAAAIVPKNDNAVYAGKLERFLNIDLQNNSMENYSNLSMFSGNADSFKNISERLLYSIELETNDSNNTIPYMKRQVFDYYDFKNNRWYADEYYSEIYSPVSEWNNTHNMLSLSTLLSSIKKAEEYSPGFAAKYGADKLINSVLPDDNIYTMKISANDFRARFYIAPVRCVNITGANDIFTTRHGTFLTKWQPHNRNAVYKIDFSDDIQMLRLWTDCGGANFDIDSSDKFLEELSDILNSSEENNNDMTDTAEMFRTQQRLACGYDFICKGNNALIPARIQLLAASITNGCVYDYEKAAAIQNYFTEQDFVYDIDYKAEDDSPEYFLFESKRGTCSDFASAYTLLARSAGLTVRYTEGFVPHKNSKYSQYTISSADSHAYPEVYIPNSGWAVYEPTVSASANTAAVSRIGFLDRLNIDIELLAVICASILIISILSAFILFILPYINERIFRIKVSSAEPNKAVSIIYKRIASKTVVKTLGDTSALTPYELAVQLKNTVGYDIFPLIFSAEEVLYGNKLCGRMDAQQALNCYKDLCSVLKKSEKNK